MQCSPLHSPLEEGSGGGGGGGGGGRKREGGILNPGADAAAGGDRIDLKVPSNYGARVILNFSSTMWDF